MRIDRPFLLAVGFGWLAQTCGELAQAEGAFVPWGSVLWVSLIVAAIAGAVGLWWDRMEDRERGR